MTGDGSVSDRRWECEEWIKTRQNGCSETFHMEARERDISGEPLGLVGGESDAVEHAALRGAHAQTHVELLRHLRVFVE